MKTQQNNAGTLTQIHTSNRNTYGFFSSVGVERAFVVINKIVSGVVVVAGIGILVSIVYATISNS